MSPPRRGFHQILVRIELRQGFRRTRERCPVALLAPAKLAFLIEAPDQPQSTQREQHRERDAERVLYSPGGLRTLALPPHLILSFAPEPLELPQEKRRGGWDCCRYLRPIRFATRRLALLLADLFDNRRINLLTDDRVGEPPKSA